MIFLFFPPDDEVPAWTEEGNGGRQRWTAEEWGEKTCRVGREVSVKAAETSSNRSFRQLRALIICVFCPAGSGMWHETHAHFSAARQSSADGHINTTLKAATGLQSLAKCYPGKLLVRWTQKHIFLCSFRLVFFMFFFFSFQITHHSKRCHSCQIFHFASEKLAKLEKTMSFPGFNAASGMKNTALNSPDGP